MATKNSTKLPQQSVSGEIHWYWDKFMEQNHITSRLVRTTDIEGKPFSESGKQNIELLRGFLSSGITMLKVCWKKNLVLM